MTKDEENLIAKVLSQPEKYSSDKTSSRYSNETEQVVWVEVKSQPMGSLLFMHFGKPSLIIKDLLSRCNDFARPNIKIWSLDKSKLLNEYKPETHSITTAIYVGVKPVKRLFRKTKNINVVTTWVSDCHNLTAARSVLVTFTGVGKDVSLADAAINEMEPYEQE